MTSALPPVMPPPSAPQSRDAAGAVGVDAQRPLRTPRAAETARAPRPVDDAQRVGDSRLPTRRDRPVGPPPAFVINLLQHLRETAFDLPEPEGETVASTAQPADSPTPRGALARYSASSEDGTGPRFDVKI